MLRIKNKTEYELLYQQSVSDPARFWDAVASSFVWRKKWDTIIDGDFSSADIRWFQGAKFNITENCLDRHLEVNGNKLAFIWEPNDPNEEERRFTYKELFNEVCKCANMLRNNGVKKGDRVCIYLPMVPEAVISMLACARIGAIHSVVFGGFSAASLAGRMQDCDNVVLITSDGAYRGDKEISLKKVADDALELCPSVKKVIVLQRTGAIVNMEEGRDQWWHDAMNGMSTQCEAEEMDAEDILFILYTSGSTGKPKGVVHTCGGYMVYTQYSFENVFQYQPDDLFWCTADVGWITGHSYITYGPLLAGASQVIFEGVPTYPDAGRFWKIIDKYNVSLFYTAPTAIRALEAAGTSFVEPYSLKSLRVLGSVGEPINVEAWNWYNTHIGKNRCPIVDTWWQTETGGILISPLAGITETKPGFATLPLPGVQPVLVDEKGLEIEGNDVEGNLCIRFPWPSIIRTTYGDHERCRQTYFSTYQGLYFTGDGCKRDKDGLYRITGRVDDVINVSGHRIGTAEVESAINIHPDIVESAVVGFPHEIKGQGIYAYVISTKSHDDLELLRKEIIAIVNKQIGPIAKPDKIQVVPGLPKTRSGKIMRRILRKIAEGDVSNLGDISTLLDPQVVEQIKNGAL
ncbi:MAG TPA: acetate--CoA ligase [Flavobacteriales bacterium]|nr:acetate--CoA ligase [Flavobacteriales bacterium]HRE95559.1 acetate--CoA ligase [Flavobacteriales bacterium]HRJ39187.1 acetate--CoA ligase [Flavobacteriales bacterium]